MRGIVVLILLTASLVHAATNNYVEVRDLRLSADGVDELQIDAGAGSLEVVGDADVSEIVVTATISVPSRKDADARRIIKSDMVLSLEGEGERAVLASYFEPGLWSWDGHPSIDLEVMVPDQVTLVVDDGSGSIVDSDIEKDFIVNEDGSGSLKYARIQGRVEKPQ